MKRDETQSTCLRKNTTALRGQPHQGYSIIVIRILATSDIKTTEKSKMRYQQLHAATHMKNL
jgi:hypothetical protein